MLDLPTAFSWRPTPLKDLLDEHFSEATFLWRQWERLLEAPNYCFAEVEDGDEYRLLAHLDGLVIGGRLVAERWLLPALEDEEEAAICVAAWALLEATDANWLEVLLERLATGSPVQRRGVARALGLSRRSDLIRSLLSKLPEYPVSLQIPLLDVLRFRHADMGTNLARLRPEIPEHWAAILSAARFSPRGLAAPLVQQALTAQDAKVRIAAMETGLLIGLRAAWAACRKSAEAGALKDRLELLALAVGGDSKDLETVAALVAVPETRQEALWALGFSGRLKAAEWLLDAVRRGEGRLAVESFAAIVGLPLEPPFVEEHEDAEVADEDVEARGAEEEALVPGGGLPSPRVPPSRVNVEQVEKWWEGMKERFEPGARYLYGRPYSAEALGMALEVVPMRRRAAMSLEIAIRSAGACCVEPRSWTAVQRQQERALHQVRHQVLSVPFAHLLVY